MGFVIQAGEAASNDRAHFCSAGGGWRFWYPLSLSLPFASNSKGAGLVLALHPRSIRLHFRVKDLSALGQSGAALGADFSSRRSRLVLSFASCGSEFQEIGSPNSSMSPGALLS